MFEVMMEDFVRRLLSPLQRCYGHFLNFWRRFPDYIIGVTIIYVFTFAIALPYLCSDLVYSVYFSPSTDTDGLIKTASDLNDDRVREAERYFAKIRVSESKSFYSTLLDGEELDLAIGVITVKRHVRGNLKLAYLTQVMARLDDIMKNDKNFPKKGLFMCDVYAGPGNHTEAMNMARYFPTHTRFPHGSPADTIKDPFDKEKEDYIYCLQMALEYRPKYIILIEDDATPYETMLQSIEKILSGERDSYLNTNRGMYTESWAFLKLFYPDRWQGYSYSDIVSIIELLSIACLGGMIFITLFYCQLARICKNSRVHKSTPDEYVVFSIGFLYLGGVAVMIGRQYWLWLLHLCNHHHIVLAPDCCSPAILYKPPMAQELITFLASQSCHHNYPLDLAMAKFAYFNDFYGLLVEPNLVRHIGMVSSIKSTIRYPQDFI